MNPTVETPVRSTPVERSIGQDGEQSRAVYPDAEGFVERDGQRLFYEIYGDGRGNDLHAPDLVAHPLPPLEDADPLLRPAFPGAHDGRARERPLGSLPQRPTLRRRGVRPRLPGGDGRDRDRARRDGEPLARRPVPAGAGAPRAGARRGRRLHRPIVPLHPLPLVGPADKASFHDLQSTCPAGLVGPPERGQLAPEDYPSSPTGGSRDASRSPIRPRGSRTEWDGRWTRTPRR